MSISHFFSSGKKAWAENIWNLPRMPWHGKVRSAGSEFGTRSAILLAIRRRKRCSTSNLVFKTWVNWLKSKTKNYFINLCTAKYPSDSSYKQCRFLNKIISASRKPRNAASISSTSNSFGANPTEKRWRGELQVQLLLGCYALHAPWDVFITMLAFWQFSNTHHCHLWEERRNDFVLETTKLIKFIFLRFSAIVQTSLKQKSAFLIFFLLLPKSFLVVRGNTDYRTC